MKKSKNAGSRRKGVGEPNRKKRRSNNTRERHTRGLCSFTLSVSTTNKSARMDGMSLWDGPRAPLWFCARFGDMNSWAMIRRSGVPCVFVRGCQNAATAANLMEWAWAFDRFAAIFALVSSCGRRAAAPKSSGSSQASSLVWCMHGRCCFFPPRALIHTDHPLSAPACRLRCHAAGTIWAGHSVDCTTPHPTCVPPRWPFGWTLRPHRPDTGLSP